MGHLGLGSLMETTGLRKHRALLGGALILGFPAAVIGLAVLLQRSSALTFLRGPVGALAGMAGLFLFTCLLTLGMLPFFIGDKRTDPSWKRAIRFVACIIAVSGACIAFAYFRS